MVGSWKPILLLLIVTGELEAGGRGPHGVTGEVVHLGEAEIRHAAEAAGHAPVPTSGLGEVTGHELLEEVALLDRDAGGEVRRGPHVRRMLNDPTAPAAREEISGKSRL